MGRVVIILAVVLALILMICEEIEARGGGGGRGGRGRGGRSGGRGGRGGRGRTYSGSVSKNTPMPATSPRSPIIVKQARVGHRPNLQRNVFVGYLAHRYALKSGILYRKSYYQHKTEIKIPEERAIRVNFTKDTMLDSNGTVCFNSSKTFTLVIRLNDRVESVVTEVRYEKLYGGKTKVFYGEKEAATIDKDALDQSVEITTVVKYNGTIVANTTCTQIQRVLNGTLVRMYDTNPDVNMTDFGIAIFVSVGVFTFIVIFCICFFKLNDYRQEHDICNCY